ncbi:uncharacterized protein LOC124880927 [Girardinichthys multiradiatus]|uniref:uncharacterized protein LOC124880927 n=1 Tax=Girardinichthys multiradiatus TaxID=208333 RepID=UPI001FADF8C8|nr:uncharacterized protein LOC124880927 [Girardinichthys multiradiatus]
MVMHTAHDSICESADNKADNCLYNEAWMKIAGPAAGPLGDVFLGSSVVVQSEVTVAGRGIQAVEEHSVNVGVYNASMSTPQGQRAEGVKPQTVGASKIIIKRPDGAQKCIKVLRAYRIVLLGETGAGKSTLGNTIFGEDVFEPGSTTEYYIQSKSVHGRRITLLDSPGFSNAHQPEGELKDKIARCTTSCTPGPHVFLIVLKVEKSSEQQLSVFDKLSMCFSEEAFKYAAVVFTHADQLQEKMNIEQYINQKQSLKDLVMKCAGRYLVIDHKCSSGVEKNNFLMMSQLFNMIDNIVIENKGGCYTNKMLQAHKRDKDGTKSGNPTQSNTDNRVNLNACNSLWINFSGPVGNVVAEAFFGSAVVASQKVQGSLKTEETEECPSTTSNEGDYKAAYSEPDSTSEAEPRKAAREIEENEMTQEGDSGFVRNVLVGVLATTVFGVLATFLNLFISGLTKLLGLEWKSGAKHVPADVRGSTGAEGATAEVGSASQSTVSGRAAGSFTKGVGGAAGMGLVGAAAWVTKKIKQLIHLYNIIKQNIGIVLLVVAFYTLLLLSFCVRVPMAGTILLSCGVLAMFLIILLLLIAI